MTSKAAQCSVARVGGLVLAAGEGRRLRPLSLACPKALVPFCGVPLLELAVSQLARIGLPAIAVNCCWRAADVARAAQALARESGPELRISREAELLGTGGGIRRALELLPDAEHVLVHNADIVLDADPAELLDRHLHSGAAATLYLVRDRGPRTVELDASGAVTCFRCPPGTAPYTFTGVQVLRRDVLDALPRLDPSSIITAYEAAAAAGQSINGIPVDTDAFWADLGTVADYVRAHRDAESFPVRRHPRLRRALRTQRRRAAALRARGVIVTGALGVGTGVAVPAGARLHDLVLWEGVALARAGPYAAGVVPGPDRSGQFCPEQRAPDPRILATLGVEPAAVRRQPLPGRGSSRCYWRLTAGRSSWIWCAYDPARTENALYAAHAGFLQRLGMRVPQVLIHLPDAAEILSADLGTVELRTLRPATARRQALSQAVAHAARLHALGAAAAAREQLPLQPPFDQGLYDWERDYFRRHCLEAVLAAPELWQPVAAEYSRVRALLAEQAPVLIHRDLQSANILVRDGAVWFLDFQGMRLGSAAYDLASLLYDPYVEVPQDWRLELWQEYGCVLRNTYAVPPPPLPCLHLAAVQRLLQALGAYGKLWRTDGFAEYREYIAPALKHLEQAARAAALPAFAALARAALARLTPFPSGAAAGTPGE